MKIVAKTKGMSREDWLAIRRTGIGGSDIPAIMGKSPFSSAFDVWLDKTGEHTAEVNSEAMEWGVILEDVVGKEFSKRTGIKLKKFNAIVCHDDHRWMLANVDRLVVGEDAGCEIKTTNAYFKDTGTCPELYALQSQWYMGITGRAKWYVPVLAGGQVLYRYEVLRNEALIDEMKQVGREFWDLVEKKEMPPIDGSEACANLLGQMYSKADDREVELPLDTFELINQYDELSEQEKSIKEKKELISNTIKSFMKDSDRAFVYDRKVYWTNVESKRFDTKAFKKENPEMYGKYVRESAYRRFQIK